MYRKVKRGVLLAWDETRFAPNNMKRVLDWLPILWRDRDWDSAYLYKIMSFKMKKMKDCIKEENRHTTVDQDVKDLSVCIEILERQFSDKNSDYEDFQRDMYCTCEVRDRMNDKYFVESDSSGLCEWKPPPLCGSCKLFYSKMMNKRNQEQMALFCDIFRRKSNSWWS